MRTALTNLTPHDLHVLDHHGCVYGTLPATGVVARVVQEMVWQRTIAWSYDVNDDFAPLSIRFDIRQTQYGQPKDVPLEIADHFYVVSQLYAAAIHEFYPTRHDFLFPGEEIRDMIRDMNGKSTGCAGLACL